MNKKQASSVLDLVRVGFVCIGFDGPPINADEKNEIFMQKEQELIMVDLSGKIYLVTPKVVKASKPVDIYSLVQDFYEDEVK